MVLPTDDAPSPSIHLVDAVQRQWLELWYQPELDLRTCTFRRVEGLVRVGHPTWGIVPPHRLEPDDASLQLQALSEFAISQAIQNWRDFLPKWPLRIGIDLPIAFLQSSAAIRHLCQSIPDHAAFEGLSIEINGSDAIRNLKLIKDVAGQLGWHKIVIAIDNLGMEWPSFAALGDFPFAEIKVAKEFVSGCSDDRMKQMVCHQILELAKGYGVRTVAQGVETRADFSAVREMGFDMAQGYYIARPSSVKKLARTIRTAQ